MTTAITHAAKKAGVAVPPEQKSLAMAPRPSGQNRCRHIFRAKGGYVQCVLDLRHYG